METTETRIGLEKVHKRLSGQHDCTLDDKGRLSVPAEFRGILGLTDGSDVKVSRHIVLPCAVIYRPDAFDALLDHAERTDTREGRMIIRVVGGAARTMSLDKTGRLSIPGPFRDHARLDGSVYVVGMDQHLQVWNPKTWNEHWDKKANEMDFDPWM